MFEQPKRKGELPKRWAHYVMLQFADGKSADGVQVSQRAKDHIRPTGFLSGASYSESLTTFPPNAKQLGGIHDRDDERRVGRVATYVGVDPIMWTPLDL